MNKKYMILASIVAFITPSFMTAMNYAKTYGSVPAASLTTMADVSRALSDLKIEILGHIDGLKGASGQTDALVKTFDRVYAEPLRRFQANFASLEGRVAELERRAGVPAQAKTSLMPVGSSAKSATGGSAPTMATVRSTQAVGPLEFDQLKADVAWLKQRAQGGAAAAPEDLPALE